MRPVWFLDIDGTINAMSSVPTSKESFSDWKEITIAGELVRYSPTVIDFINQTSEKVDVIWLSTWGQQARTELAPALGLKDFDVTEFIGVNHPASRSKEMDISTQHKRWWKLNAVLNHIQTSTEQVHFLWSDDHLDSFSRSFVRDEAFKEGIECSFVTPKIEAGITPEDIHSISYFFGQIEKYYGEDS